MNQSESTVRLDRVFGRLGAIALVVGAILVIVGLSFGFDQKLFFQSYLTAFCFWTVLSFGCLGLMKLHHSIRGRWGKPALRIWEAAGGPHMMIFLAILFVVLAIGGMDTLYYKWSDPAYFTGDSVVEHKLAYLNPARFLIFGLACFGVFAFFGWRMMSLQKKQDETEDRKYENQRMSWGAAGLVVFVIIVNFLSTDWVMSLDPHWFSTMFGAIFVVCAGLSGLAFTAMIVGAHNDKKPYSEVADKAWRKDLGNLMLAFTMLWAYFKFSEYLIIWSGDLFEFIPYLIARSNGHWNAIGLMLMLGSFFIPFLLLLSPAMKRNAGSFAFIGGWILVMRYVDMQYIIAPFFRPEMPIASGNIQVIAFDIGLFALIGAAWSFIFVAKLRSAPLLPWIEPGARTAHEH